MKIFGVGINNYWHTAFIILDEVPAPLYYLFRFTEFICDHTSSIPFKKIILKMYR